MTGNPLKDCTTEAGYKNFVLEENEICKNGYGFPE